MKETFFLARRCGNFRIRGPLAALALGGALWGCAPREPAPPPASAEGRVETRSAAVESVVRPDLARYFEGVEGTFVLYDADAARYVRYNPERARERFLPASTFKIPNSLIALETGVVPDVDRVLAWDSAAAPRRDWWPAPWSRSHDMRSAFAHSVVWYYQELARRIGAERMQRHLDRFGYGNRDLSGGIDRFWLSGGLRISPDEQVEFLRRFYEGELGISPRATQAVKEIMVLESTPEYRLSGKTGTAELSEERELGWLVGYVERAGKVYYYALNVEGEDVFEEWSRERRREVAKRILRDLDVLPDPARTAALSPAPGDVRLAPDVLVRRLAPGLWVHVTLGEFPGPAYIPVNGALLETEDGSVLFDTGWNDRQAEVLLDWAARDLGRPVRRAVVTHSHYDRTGGIRALRARGIPVAGLALTAELARAEGNPAPDSVIGLESGARRDPAGFELLYPGAGHTRDNVVVYFPRQRVLLGGCLVKADTATTLGNVADADVPNWPRAVARVRAAYPEARIVIPGHGALGGPSALTWTERLVREKGR